MRAVRAPTECIMRDGYYLHQDILNPITTKCPNGAPIVTAPPTTKPAPVTDEPPSVGTINETSPWGTPTPADAWNPAPVTPSPTKASYVSSVSSSNDSGFRIGAVIGILFDVIFLLAFVMGLRQKNKRDPSVQKNQRLSYSDVGDFDTVLSSAPTYAPTAEYYREQRTPVAEVKRVDTDVDIASTRSSRTCLGCFHRTLPLSSC